MKNQKQNQNDMANKSDCQDDLTDLEDNFLMKINKVSYLPRPDFQEIELGDGSHVSITKNIATDEHKAINFQGEKFSLKIQNKKQVEDQVYTMLNFMGKFKETPQFTHKPLYPLFTLIYTDGSAKHGSIYSQSEGPISDDIFLYISEHEKTNDIKYVLLATEVTSGISNQPKNTSCDCDHNCDQDKESVLPKSAISLQSWNRITPEKSLVIIKEFTKSNNGLAFKKPLVFPMDEMGPIKKHEVKPTDDTSKDNTDYGRGSVGPYV